MKETTEYLDISVSLFRQITNIGLLYLNAAEQALQQYHQQQGQKRLITEENIKNILDIVLEDRGVKLRETVEMVNKKW